MLEDAKSKVLPPQFLSTASAAKILGLSTTLVQTLVDQGDLKGWKTRGGHRRISVDSVLDYQNQTRSSTHRKIRTLARPLISVTVENPVHIPSLKNDVHQWQLPIDVSFFESVTAAILDLSTHRPDMMVLEMSMSFSEQEKTLQALESFNKRGKSPLSVVIITQEKRLMSSLPNGSSTSIQLVPGPISSVWLHAYLTGILASSRF